MSRFYLSTALLFACCTAAWGQSATPAPDGDVVRTDLRPDEVEISEKGRKKSSRTQRLAFA